MRSSSLACNSFKDGFEGNTESTHPDASEAVGSRPDDIRVGEIHGRSLIERLGSGAKSAIFGHEQVEYDLLVADPVAAICKDEDSVYFDLVEVSQAGVIGFVLGELPEGRRVLVVFIMSPGVTTSLKPYPSATWRHFSPSPPTTRTVWYFCAISRIGVWPQMNWPGDTSISSCWLRSSQRSSSVLPPPLVTNI